MSTIYRPSSPIEWNWVSLTGADARDFLHRVTSAEVRQLEVGHGTRGCFLSPQGRIRSFFTLWNYGSDEFACEFDAGTGGRGKRELLAAIDQYTFSEKMTLTDLTPATGTGLACVWILAETSEEVAKLVGPLAPLETRAVEPVIEGVPLPGIRLCHQGTVDFGRPWITAWGEPARLSEWIERALPSAAPASLDFFAQLEAWRIDALRPWVDREISESVGPLELGLTDAVAGQKGCYPGQEVIEKILALGAPAKRLAVIEWADARPPGGADSFPQPGAKLFNLADAPVEVGELTSVSPVAIPGARARALALVRKIHAKEGIEVKLENGRHGKIARIAPYA